jgi:hypothetical protein
VTPREWLRERRPEAPRSLLARMETLLGPTADHEVTDLFTVLLDASSRTLDDVIASPTAGRETALDLLAADAFATYAFEVSATSPDRLTTHARRALRRLGRTGTRR